MPKKQAAGIRRVRRNFEHAASMPEKAQRILFRYLQFDMRGSRSMSQLVKTFCAFATPLLIAVAITACSHDAPVPPAKTADPLRSFSSDQFFNGKVRPLCKALFDSYCGYLYSPEAMGNIEVKRKPASLASSSNLNPSSSAVISILQGETKNQFSQVYFKYSLAKLRNKRSLPRDFANALTKNLYFEKLRTFLDRAPRDRMTIQQRLETEQIGYELSYLWSSALNETVLSRMVRRYSGFHRIADQMVPVELDLERRRQRRELISDISKAIWRDDANWQKVEDGFSSLQRSYAKMIDRLDIEESLKSEWISRIKEIKLVLPGSMPSISDDECSTTTINAYYFTYLNVLTVCAGDFNSEDILQTLAHEMGHALGIDRTQYLFEMKSDLGVSINELRNNVCAPDKFSCDSWKQFKSSFDQDLLELASYRPQLPEFERCLKRRPTTKVLGPEEIRKYAVGSVADRVSSLASSDRFLRITKAEVPMPNGKIQKNPNYLNPCSYYLWSKGEEPIDDELSTLMFFTAEYRCSDGTAAERLKHSIDLSRDFSLRIEQETLKIEGEFSARPELEHEGYASPPFERFADVIGSYAMAELLKEIPDQWDRQNRYLASSSWQCSEPSIQSSFPIESAIENLYVYDSHTEGDIRKKELFSTPIREVIGCQKDFEFNECSLPFRK